MKITELIAAAPWREPVTYRETSPPEYVLPKKDEQRVLMRAVWQRMHDGEAFNGYFFLAQTTGQPHIAPDFLGELARSLPPMAFCDDDDAYYGDYDDDGYEGFHAPDERMAA